MNISQKRNYATDDQQGNNGNDGKQNDGNQRRRSLFGGSGSGNRSGASGSGAAPTGDNKNAPNPAGQQRRPNLFQSGARKQQQSHQSNDQSQQSSQNRRSLFQNRNSSMGANGQDASQQTPFQQNRTQNRISQSGSSTIKMFDEQNQGRKINEPGKGERPAYTSGTGKGGVPTNAYVEQRRKPLFGRPQAPVQKPPSSGSVHADLNRDDNKALRTPFRTDKAGQSVAGKDGAPPQQQQPRRSLFSRGLFGQAPPAPSAVGTDSDPNKAPAQSSASTPNASFTTEKARRPLFSVSSPFAKPAQGPQRATRPQDIVPSDPKRPVTPATGIPKTAMYGIEHDQRLKREIDRSNLLRERTRNQLQDMAVRAKVGQRHRFWENIDTEDMRLNIHKQYNKQRFEMLKPLLDLVHEVDTLQEERDSQQNTVELDALSLQSLDDQVNGFLNSNPKLKSIVGTRLNPWSIIEDQKYAREVLTEKTLQLNGYNLLDKLDQELTMDPSAERTFKHFFNLDEIRANQKDFKAYELAARLINTNIPKTDAAHNEWQALKEDMARVLNLNVDDMQSQRLLTASSPFRSRNLQQKTPDTLQDKARNFVDSLRQSTHNEDMSALDAYKLHQEEEESLVKALRSRDKVALLSDPYGGTVIGLSNHVIVYEAQMKQIIRDHNRRLRLLREAKEKFHNQYGRVEILDTAPVMHIAKIKGGRQIQAPLYRYVERFVDRIPDSVAKRRLASHARVIMRNKYLTLDEKRVMVGNLAQVYRKYRLHLHMEDATPKPVNSTHIHGEIRRFGGM
eukprot:CAMPEP_0117439026 /NCGR_PEP_ID=MMETSP0759-20121206/2357_1 /TAXON_ID=63605 /ORGANISM="Percolomonas cosmopolitus, Strain WS" /LENGTH=788 /DNA_ID=CAMNT_0005230737 /DNA_START=222 /DNA_END=2588 /DNA_ORIENTATION=+